MSSDPKSNGSLGLTLPDPLPGITRWQEDQNFAKLLVVLRREFQVNNSVRECFTAHTREERRQGVLHFLASFAFGFGGQQVLERAVDYLLDELEQMQKEGHGQYLIDVSTGKAVAPLTEDMVYQQPDFVNEDGQLVKGKKVVNPAVASALGLAKQEQNRTQLALESSGGSLAFEHLRDPDSILRVARVHLDAAELPESPDGKEVVIMVGREQSDGVFQSPNRGFHRHELYGQLLARRIVKDGHKACSLVGLEKKTDSKCRWFEVRVRVPDQGDGGTPSAPPQ